MSKFWTFEPLKIIMKNSITNRKSFDYNGLPDNQTRAILRKEATSIKLAVRRTHDNIIEIGNRLIHAKEVAGHGKFLDWIDAEFAISYDKANDFMNVAKAFSKLENSPTLTLSESALFALSSPSISDETREIIIEETKAGNVKTLADVREWVDAAKPIIPAQEPEQKYPADEPENQSDYEAIPVEEDDDFPDPFDDEIEEPEVEILADQQPVLEPEKPVKETTLKERVKNAEVFHNTLDNAVKPEELSEEEWLQSLPIFRVLSQKQHRGIFLKRDLLAARQLAEHQKLFAHHAKRQIDFKAPSGTYYTRAVIALASMPAPMDWQICSPCKGGGCQRCAHAGYDTTGAGISPLRIENGEVAL